MAKEMFISIKYALQNTSTLTQALINERVMLCDKPLAYAAAPRVPCGSGPSDTCIICQLWAIDQVPPKSEA